MTAPELRPCPFCGRDNIQYCGGVYSCVDCGAEAPYNLKGDDAASIWNTRADLSPAAIAAAMMGAVEYCDRLSEKAYENGEEAKGRYLSCISAGVGDMIPTDAAAALEEIKRQVWDEALEAAAAKILEIYGCSTGDKMAAEIRAMKKGGE